MKKTIIRQKVFETNSSSSHSISIADSTKEFVLDTIYPDQNGVIILTGGEFGWDWFKHNDALTKANYVAVSYGLTDNLKEAIIEQTGAEDVVYTGSEDYDNNWSYVDHDSYGVAPSTKEEIKNFVFNKNSFLLGGNDNETADPTFYHLPEYKDGKETVPVYTHQLRVEGYNKTTKFLHKPSEEEIEQGLSSILQGVKLYDSGYFDDNNSVMAQIHRPDGYFEYNSWKKPTDLENGIVNFIKEAWNDAHDEYELTNPTKDDWSTVGYKKVREIEERLLSEPNSKYTKPVKFYVDEIPKR